MQIFLLHAGQVGLELIAVAVVLDIHAEIRAAAGAEEGSRQILKLLEGVRQKELGRT